MRILMSFDTSTTGRPSCLIPPSARRGSGCRPAHWQPVGSPRFNAVGRTSGPWHPCCPAWTAGYRVFDGVVIRVADQGIEGTRHLACIARHFRHALFVVVQLSRVIIGRYTSCSSKRNSDDGSCISTLVSSTNSLLMPRWSAARLADDGAVLRQACALADAAARPC